jgi:CheY-like chemotaxis protein
MARILIVEDEALIALMLEDFVRDAGHEVFGVAGSVAKAEALIATDTPDAALLDVRLGKELSYPIAASLKERCVPFAFMTGYEAQTIDKTFARLGDAQADQPGGYRAGFKGARIANGNHRSSLDCRCGRRRTAHSLSASAIISRSNSRQAPPATFVVSVAVAGIARARAVSRLSI